MTEPAPPPTPLGETAPIDVATEPPPKKRAWWKIWTPREKKPKRPLLIRLFGMNLWGSIKLVLICIFTGFVMLAMQFDPSEPSFDATDAIGAFVSNAVATGKWAITNFWKPALAGATIILPIWVLWRLVTLPFRR
ncbi:MAG: hypothetical protein ABJG15_17130 [Hyphomonadaceae bacterium]